MQHNFDEALRLVLRDTRTDLRALQMLEWMSEEGEPAASCGDLGISIASAQQLLEQLDTVAVDASVRATHLNLISSLTSTCSKLVGHELAARER